VSALLRRIAGSILLVWLVVTLTFVLVRAAPGDAADLLVPPTATAADAARVRADLGLDAPVAVQYARWVGAILKGDLGESFARREPVRRVLAESLPVSLALGGVSLALSWILGVLVGAVQGTRRGTALDTSLTIATTTVYAAPAFWMALALVAVFTYGAAVWHFPAFLRLPAFGLHDPAGLDTGWSDLARHAVLPVLVLTAIGAAGVARYARSSVADLAAQDFVRTARAKGAGPARVLLRHLLSNALAPLVVLLALSLPGLVAGSVFVESVFGWPGMGRAMLSAIAARDTPVVLGATLVYATLVIAANLAADLALPLLDPRRRT
jgi:peptide/nickel transport system permease protein